VLWPALDVADPADIDTTLAFLDDFGPTAVEERGAVVRIFFASSGNRDAAAAALAASQYSAQAIDVDDEDWARRSQAGLRPVTVGRITVAPPWAALPPASSTTEGIVIVVQPSTGFGTGHHATTRLCLRALQAVPLSGRSVVDVGTGSGVLALAAVMLGAAHALGIDNDADAIRAANENLELNNETERVEFRLADLSADRLPTADVVTANLTGAFLIRSAPLLWDLVHPAGTLIVSGLLEHERGDVVRALQAANGRRGDAAGAGKSRPDRNIGATVSAPRIAWEQSEQGWVALGMCCN
jgi:ribosomal protein L11 methyltransferase